MSTRPLTAAPHVDPSARPRAGAVVTATLVSLANQQAVAAWVVDTGHRVVGNVSTTVRPDGTWLLDLYPNDQLATATGGTTAWAIKVVGYPPVTLQFPTDGSGEFYELVSQQVVLEPGRLRFPAASTYTHPQPIPAAVWTVAHNLGRRPAVQVVDHLGALLISDVHHESDDILTIIHGAPMIGAVYCI